MQKRPLLPRFLERLDRYLLLNRPDTWSARAHLLLYYVLILMGIEAVLSFLAFNEPLEVQGVAIWTVFASVIACIGLVFWLIYLVRFNVFKRFGNLGQGDNIKTFVLYLICTAMLVLSTFVPAAIESVRANFAFSDAEVVRDVNNINAKILQLESDSVDKRWEVDTLVIMRTRGSSSVIQVRNDFKLVDSTEFKYLLQYADSSVRIKDSMYKLLTCPNYQFAHDYLDQDYYYEYSEYGLPQKSKGSKFLFYKYLQSPQPVNKNEVYSSLRTILKKYNAFYTSPYANDISKLDGENYYGRIIRKYDLGSLNSRISTLSEKKTRFRERNLPAYTRVVLYISFILTGFVFAFRRSTTKIFFLSLLSGVLLFILTLLVTSLAIGNSIGLLSIFLVYYVLFFIVAGTGMYAGTREAVSGIAINLLTFISPWIPMAVVKLVFEIIKRSEKEYQRYYDREMQWFAVSELLGIVFMLLMVEFVLAKFYKKWYSLPEE